MDTHRVGKIILDFAYIENGVYLMICSLAGNDNIKREIVEALVSPSDNLFRHELNLKKLIPVLDKKGVYTKRLNEILEGLSSAKDIRNHIAHGFLEKSDDGAKSFLAKKNKRRVIEIKETDLIVWSSDISRLRKRIEDVLKEVSCQPRHQERKEVIKCNIEPL